MSTNYQTDHEGYQQRWWAARHERTREQCAAYEQVRKDAERAAFVDVVARALTQVFVERPDVAPLWPSDAARRRLAEQVAGLVLAGDRP